MQVPAEIIHTITLYVEAGDYGSWEDEDDSRQYKITKYGFRKRLATLRMVNKAFCQSASPRLFQHLIATFRYNHDVSGFVGLCELSSSSYAPHVRHIDIGIDRWASDSKIAIYAEDLTGLLSPCLVRFPNLRSLEFIGASGREITQETKNKLMTSIISALRYVSMPALEELDISFPITHDFGQLFHDKASTLRIPIESVLRRLRHLGLHVHEWTGRRGQRYWPQTVTPENAALPNETFAVNIFNLINLAENIQSLAIGSTNILDLDNAIFPYSLRLRSLYLSGVSISADILLNLLGNWTDSIRFIQFWRVELNAGTWSHVLVKMSMFLILIDFHMDSSGYSLAGTSGELRPRLLPEPDDPQEIESMDFRDFHALAILQHRVNGNRIATGLPKIPDSTYRAARMHNIESAMAVMRLGD